MSETRRGFLARLLPRFLVGAALLYVFPRRLWAAAPPLNDPRYLRLFLELKERHGFSEEFLTSAFSRAEMKEEAIGRMERPAEALPYFEYRRRFLKDEMVSLGRDYLAGNLDLFVKVEGEFGVEKEVICAILGIESKFGARGVFNFRVFDVLNTFFSNYPKREAFYRSEMIEYLLLCREERIDPLALTGSYAGAFGVPQFMPSSYRRFALDYDSDGKKDLWNSKPDILASVSHYLRNFRWRLGSPIVAEAEIVREGADAQRLLTAGLKSSFPILSLQAAGIRLLKVPPGAEGEEVSLVTYEPRESAPPAMAAIFENFRALLRYNAAINYGLVVSEFSEILRKR